MLQDARRCEDALLHTARRGLGQPMKGHGWPQEGLKMAPDSDALRKGLFFEAKGGGFSLKAPHFEAQGGRV